MLHLGARVKRRPAPRVRERAPRPCFPLPPRRTFSNPAPMNQTNRPDSRPRSPLLSAATMKPRRSRIVLKTNARSFLRFCFPRHIAYRLPAEIMPRMSRVTAKDPTDLSRRVKKIYRESITLTSSRAAPFGNRPLLRVFDGREEHTLPPRHYNMFGPDQITTYYIFERFNRKTKIIK